MDRKQERNTGRHVGGKTVAHKEPTVAPGFNDEKFGEDASPKDIREGKSTRVTRVFLDENDPS